MGSGRLHDDVHLESEKRLRASVPVLLYHCDPMVGVAACAGCEEVARRAPRGVGCDWWGAHWRCGAYCLGNTARNGKLLIIKHAKMAQGGAARDCGDGF